MRSEVVFFLNGEEHRVRGEDAFRNLSEYLRYRCGLTGTKVVCAEGDCGACTVIAARYSRGRLGAYRTLNSCIAPVFSMDQCHLITVEGLSRDARELHPVSRAMVEAHGAQCGYCTPGFVCSLAAAVDHVKASPGAVWNGKRIRNCLTGNLCRCTGYEPILKAGEKIPLAETPRLETLFDPEAMQRVFDALPDDSVEVEFERRIARLSKDLPDAVEFLARNPGARVISGSTDMGVVANKRNLRPDRLLALPAVSELAWIEDQGDSFRIGARASLTDVESALKGDFPEFSRMLHVFASPQIKNSGTLVGNLVNASPIADTIPFLRVAEARVELRSQAGVRELGLDDFIRPGYKQLDLAAGELVTAVLIPKTRARFKLYKVANRKDLDISTVALAIRYRVEEGCLADFALAAGGVGPSVLRLPAIEARLSGLCLSDPSARGQVLSAADAIRAEIRPLSDVRGSAEYRHQLCRNLLLRFFDEVADEAGVRVGGVLI
jgi:xanthine dehydrogenase small subunit